MPKQPGHLRDRSLAMPLAAALAVKAVVLTMLYFAFFTPPPDPISTAERAVTAVFGFPARP